jgi:hypothetical protein
MRKDNFTSIEIAVPTDERKANIKAYLQMMRGENSVIEDINLEHLYNDLYSLAEKERAVAASMGDGSEQVALSDEYCDITYEFEQGMS